MRSFSMILLAGALTVIPVNVYAQRSKVETSPIHDVMQSTLIAPDSAPFHLVASITEGRDRSPYARVEIFWSAPDKFARTIQSRDFNQTLVVNGSQTYENDSSDYFPIGLRTLVTDMVDPRLSLDAIHPGDSVLTKANGAVNDSGLVCSGPSGAVGRMCFRDTDGLRETLGASGHGVTFSHYSNFKGKPVARTLTNAPRLGEDLMTLSVEKLDELKSPDPALFQVKENTNPKGRLRFKTLSETELKGDAVGSPQIIWPQPLDGSESGDASFYLSIDRIGKVREVLPLYTANERTNDSAVSQLMTWRFRPANNEELPAQAEGILTFKLNTRSFGPAEPLKDSEARKLASNITEPEIPGGKYPAGTLYTLWIAVDSDGKVIEAMAGDGPHELFMPCYSALRKWTFHPVMENGEPRPYRAQIAFHTP
jgi:hypothetical protein